MGGWLDKSILKLISAPVWALAGAELGNKVRIKKNTKYRLYIYTAVCWLKMNAVSAGWTFTILACKQTYISSSIYLRFYGLFNLTKVVNL